MNPWWKRTDDEGDPKSGSPSASKTSDAPPPASTQAEPAVADSVEATSPSDGDSNAPETSESTADEKPAVTRSASGREKSTTRSRSRSTRAKKAVAVSDDGSSETEAIEPKPRARRRAPRRSTSSTASSTAGPTAGSTTGATGTAAKATPASREPKAREEPGEAPKKPARRRSSRAKKPNDDDAPAPEPVVAATPTNELLELFRDSLTVVPDRSPTDSDERKIAVLFDFENIALGIKDSDIPKFEIGLVLERLLEKGKIIVKKAYADWERYSEYKKVLHGAAIELIDIPQKYYSGKNSADIKLVVDAMELASSKEHLDTFAILSGDSDFSPLVSKLRENDKHVIGVGVKNSSSKLLIDNCDEFIFYEDLWRDSQQAPKLEGLDKKSSEVFKLMTESIQALIRENKDVLWGSMIKQTMQRKRPSFNEGYYGYSSFSELLEEGEKRNLINLKRDTRSGSYIVTGFSRSR